MKHERPDKLNYRVVNETGFIVESSCRLPELKCYVEGGSVYFYASVLNDNEDNEIEALQYLTPEIAMKMSKALEVMAIQAFKERSIKE